jgi:hypothetical protein
MEAGIAGDDEQLAEPRQLRDDVFDDARPTSSRARLYRSMGICRWAMPALEPFSSGKVSTRRL